MHDTDINQFLPSVEQVHKVCGSIGISIDWHYSEKSILASTPQIMAALGWSVDEVSVGVLAAGIEVEIEHGTDCPETNITNNHPLITAKIALRHIKEGESYYPMLATVEAKLEKEGLFLEVEKAAKSRNIKKMLLAIEMFEKKYEEEY